jgi:hypothetical protein
VRRGIRWRRTLARAVAAVGTTQSLDRAVILLPFAGLPPGDVAVLRPSATTILFGTILAIAARPLRDVLLRRGLKPGLTVTATWPAAALGFRFSATSAATERSHGTRRRRRRGIADGVSMP